MTTIRPALKNNPQEMAHLLTLWEDSVRATHHFLPEQMINTLRPLVKEGLQVIETLLVLVDEHETIQSFMGIQAQKLEMLFLAPSVLGKGYGRLLITHAIQHFNIREIDVNEQNPKTAGFYQHMGFEIIGRSELDDQGNPYPILHLRMKPTAQYSQVT